MRTANKRPKTWWEQLLCWFGFHDWEYDNITDSLGNYKSYRQCKRCGGDQHKFCGKWKE